MVVILTASCTSPEVPQDTIQSWYGADVEALTEAWGPPTAQWDRPAGDGRVLEYASYTRAVTEKERAVGRAIAIASGGAIGGLAYGLSDARPGDCVVRFIITPGGIVASGLMTGRRCPAQPTRE